jgi:cytidylate kinase
MIVTIGGRVGAGKSSVSKALAAKLGYKFYGAGDIRRKYAISKGMTIAELNEEAKKNPESDRLVDDYMKKMAETEDNFVIDAWLGFYFFPKSIKIFLDAHPKLRAERIFKRAKPEERPNNPEEALKMLIEREECSLRRYKHLYGVENTFDLKNYDFIVDTTKNTVEQTTDIIYKFVMNRMKKQK